MLARIFHDICAIPAFFVPCEHLFSSGGEVTTDCLDAEKFEEIQVLKHSWCHNVVDHAALNSAQVEEVSMDEYKELWAVDEELAQIDARSNEVVDS
jgi:hypothetical protein